MLHYYKAVVQQPMETQSNAAVSTLTTKPKVLRQLDWEVDLNLMEDWIHFCVHKNEMKYNRAFFVEELERAMRTYMHLNEDVRSFATPDPELNSVAPKTKTTRLDNFI